MIKVSLFVNHFDNLNNKICVAHSCKKPFNIRTISRWGNETCKLHMVKCKKCIFVLSWPKNDYKVVLSCILITQTFSKVNLNHNLYWEDKKTATYH